MIATTKPILVISFVPFVASFSLWGGIANRLRPSSTDHLADLLELYDIIQDPAASSESWRSAFGDMIESVSVTSEGVVEGKGLVAKRDFEVGEAVALYPIHAIGYSNGRSPPRIHERSERVYSRPMTARGSVITGTSDLLYFEDERNVFGEDQDDFSYTMIDPSGKYCFDVNPERCWKVKGNEANSNKPDSGKTNNTKDNDNCNLFVAHYVNDASFANFSPIVNAAKELKQKHPSNIQSIDDLAKAADDLDLNAIQTAVSYLGTSTGTMISKNMNQEVEPNPPGFNVVMCAFGPPPLMAYVTIRPVRSGEEFLASYGLGYWLGKAFPEDDGNEAFEAALLAQPDVRRAVQRAEDAVQEALDVGDAAVRSWYQRQTHLIRDTIAKFCRDNRFRHRRQMRSKLKKWWKKRRHRLKE
mmetsp:Transcript_19195/g.29247  ORF Transcript_19195/g.29247 Transcript_19195/m.29247 type:complete len:414 (+) Transcript_19195:140-1381(+)